MGDVEQPGVEAGPYCCSSRGQEVEARQGGLDPLHAQLQLHHVASELLAQCEGRGVHGVGPADLDDLFELLGLRLQCVVELPDRKKH